MCFRCDEKFGPGHVCANKQLQVLVLIEEDDEVGTTGDTNAIEEEGEPKDLQLSMCSIAGLSSKKTIKLWGKLGRNKSWYLLIVEPLIILFQPRL